MALHASVELGYSRAMSGENVENGVDPEGRWHGRITSRPLPDSDPSVDALPPAAREELAEHWLARAASERRVEAAFEVVRDALREAGAPAPLLALAERAIDDERRHTRLAHRVAERFAGRSLDEPARLPLVVPEHRGASPEVRRALHVLGHCAVNETFASAVLEAALAASEGALARAALRELLADEIDHARIGWGYLASLDAETRAALEPWLPSVLRANLRSWRLADRAYPSDPALVAQGALTEPLIASALLVALRTLVLPGLRHVGICIDSLVAWVEQGALSD